MWGPSAGVHKSMYYPHYPMTASSENYWPQACFSHDTWTAPKERAAPAYVKPTACLGSGKKTWKVVISGLDKALCKQEMMEVMLDQAQVAEHVTNCRIKAPRSACEHKRDISVSFSSQAAATRCVQHFDGRQWGTSGDILAARIEQPNARLAPTKPLYPQLAYVEGGLSEGCSVTEHALEAPPGLAALTSDILPPPGLEAVTLRAPPGLGFSHDQDWSKRHSIAEDSTDAGTSVADEEPADEELQIAVSL